MKKIFIITGDCTSGKTTLLNELKKKNELRFCTFRDIDDNGIPEIPTIKWRIDTINWYFEYFKSTNNICIFSGMIYPEEILSIFKDFSVFFIYLDMSYEIRQYRIKQHKLRIILEYNLDNFFYLKECFSKNSKYQYIKIESDLISLSQITNIATEYICVNSVNVDLK